MSISLISYRVALPFKTKKILSKVWIWLYLCIKYWFPFDVCIFHHSRMRILNWMPYSFNAIFMWPYYSWHVWAILCSNFIFTSVGGGNLLIKYTCKHCYREIIRCWKIKQAMHTAQKSNKMGNSLHKWVSTQFCCGRCIQTSWHNKAANHTALN